VEDQAFGVLLAAKESLKVCIGTITKSFSEINSACEKVLIRIYMNSMLC
jgi:hypothetical protein